MSSTNESKVEIAQILLSLSDMKQISTESKTPLSESSTVNNESLGNLIPKSPEDIKFEVGIKTEKKKGRRKGMVGLKYESKLSHLTLEEKQERKREQARKWRQKNKERHAELRKQWVLNHKREFNKYQREYYHAHKASNK